MTATGDYGGGWYTPNITMGSTTATWNWPQTVNLAREQAPVGWKCADCGTVMAPWVPAHHCGRPSAPADDATHVLNKDEAGG